MANVTIEIKAETLLRALNIALEHASTDETRPHLACVRVEPGGGTVRLVATDGHRLSCHDVPATSIEDGPYQLPRAACVQLRNAIKSTFKSAPKHMRSAWCVSLEHTSEGACNYAVGNTRATAQCETEPFPPYEQAFPKYDPERKGCAVGINGAYLAAAAKACGALNEHGNFRMEHGKPLAPVTFTTENSDGEKLRIVVMPVRL